MSHPARRSAAALALGASLFVWLPTTATGPPTAATGRPTTVLRLPTESDALALAPGAEKILYGPQGVETQLPGPVTDAEQVSVSIGAAGEVTHIEVVQRLTITGLGDFSFKVPGPALDVEALPGSDSAPGLRRGAVLWQGFSRGQELLAARLQLHPELEADRLPVRFSISTMAAGRPVALGQPMTGSFEIRLRVVNNTAFPVSVSRAEGDPTQLAPVLDGLAVALREGRRPRPGEGPIPRQVTAVGPVTSETVEAAAPTAVTGRLVFPPGAVRDVRAEGGAVAVGPSGTEIAFQTTLGGGRPSSFELRITGSAEGLLLPEFRASAAPALPDPSQVAPPRGPTWQAALQRDPSALDGREMLAVATDVLWAVAGLRRLDAYVGNPDPTGRARTTFAFVLLPPKADSSPEPAPAAGVNALGVIAWIAALLLVLFALALGWANA